MKHLIPLATPNTLPRPSAPRPVQAPGGTRMGRVSLVGAGPGDPDLLTVAAIKAIRSATVLLVDDLVSSGVLRYARRSARIISVGKRGGCPVAAKPSPALAVGSAPAAKSLGGRPPIRTSTPQAFILKLMVAEAQRGETVVRLKGGDPLIFGRGGEEAEYLRAAGVPVQVVNGISSGLAAATALGVPLTHRDHAHGVILVTGHAGQASQEVHWPSLAAAAAQGLTLVVYMGVQRLAVLQAGLLQGLGANTPAALVQQASTAQEQRLLTTLGRLVQDAANSGIASPAVLVVGDVLKGCEMAGLKAHAARGDGGERAEPKTCLAYGR